MEWILFIVILALLILSALFSSAETALTAASRARIYRLAKEGKSGARKVLRLQNSMETLLGVILLGNNLVNIFATSLATALLIGIFGESALGIATIIMTLLIVVFGEVMPKVYALQNPIKVSLNLSLFISFMFRFLSPVASFVRFIVRYTWKMGGVDVKNVRSLRSAREEILSLVEMYSDKQVKREKNMLRGILDLSTVPVSDVMIHRKDLMTISANEPMNAILEQLIASPYSRFPVWKDSPDNIIGILHIKSLLKEFTTHTPLPGKVVNYVQTDPWFVPESTSLLHQLHEFKARRAHMALVVDEYGALEGLVTLEDILEEIVGEISDEYDQMQHQYRKEKDGAYLIMGHATLRDLNKEFDWQLPSQDAATLAGLLLHETQGIPIEGETYQFYGYRFKIVERKRNQLIWIKVTPPRNLHNAP